MIALVDEYLSRFDAETRDTRTEAASDQG